MKEPAFDKPNPGSFVIPKYFHLNFTPMKKLFTLLAFVATFATLQAQVLQNDIALQAISTPQFHLVNTPIALTGTLLNTGETTLHTFRLNWSDGTTAHSHNITDVAVLPGQSFEFTHNVPFVAGNAKSHNLSVWVDQPNGELDTNPGNNGKTTVVSAVTNTPIRRVLVEEGTGTWCGWCPRGFYWMSYMHENYPETFIGVAVHNGDPMAISAYDNAIGFSAYPSAHVNRKKLNIGVGENFIDEYEEAITEIVPFDISVIATYQEDSPDELSITARVEFVTELSDIDYRFGGAILENGVIGEGTPYNQANFYSFQAADLPLSGFGYDWQALPNPVVAAEMVYPDVARSLLGPFNGLPASIPGDVSVGQVVERSFTYFVPATVNIEQVRAVVWVIDNETGQIINSAFDGASLPVNTSEVLANNALNVFPNPFQDQLNLQLTLDQTVEVEAQLFNALGQLVNTQTYGAMMGEQTLSFYTPTLANGLYTVVVKAGNQVSTKRVVLQR